LVTLKDVRSRFQCTTKFALVSSKYCVYQLNITRYLSIIYTLNTVSAKAKAEVPNCHFCICPCV